MGVASDFQSKWRILVGAWTDLQRIGGDFLILGQSENFQK